VQEASARDQQRREQTVAGDCYRVNNAHHDVEPRGESGARLMARISLTLAIRDYAHIAPLALGDVTVEGVDLTLRRSFDAPQRVLADPTIDGGEASFSRYLQRVAERDEAFFGIPAFVMRGFRHRCVFVRRGSTLADLPDLIGSRVGLNEWGATGHTWTRAAFRERGIDLTDIRWFVGPLSPSAPPAPATSFPAYVEAIPDGATLTEQLLAGDLDAILASEPPAGFHPTEGPIVRLFRDFVSTERGYFARTGVEPAHHLVTLRREIVADHPWLPGRLLEALEASRRQAATTRRLLGDVTPWLLAELEETEALMGATAGAYGVEPNREMIATFCGEQFAQGLVAAPIDSESAFAWRPKQS
jgi:4,5-dihydroxyphthalate decarboxylase